VARRPWAKRFRINGSNPIPASIKVNELGSGVVMNPAYLPVNIGVLVDVFVPMTVDSPVSPAKMPVPPVITVSSVTVEVTPVTVPFSVKVPNTVPPAKTSMNVPLAVNIVPAGLKVSVPMFVVVKLPDTVSTPEPVKVESKTKGSAVAVRVEFPVTVPDVGVESA